MNISFETPGTWQLLFYILLAGNNHRITMKCNSMVIPYEQKQKQKPPCLRWEKHSADLELSFVVWILDFEDVRLLGYDQKSFQLNTSADKCLPSFIDHEHQFNIHTFHTIYLGEMCKKPTTQAGCTTKDFHFEKVLKKEATTCLHMCWHKFCKLGPSG